VLSGECKTWKALDSSLPEKPIVLLIRDMAGSANELLQSKVLEEKTFRADALQMPSMGAILRRLEENPNAVAFLSSGMAYSSDELRVHAFEGVAPTNANVLAGTYPLTRPMLLLVKGEPDPYQQAFIDFVLGPGQAIVEAHGYVPVKTQ
jgi:phosphate transport system substrate-binding protein